MSNGGTNAESYAARDLGRDGGAVRKYRNSAARGCSNPAYIADAFDRIRNHTVNHTDELLSWNWTPHAVPPSEVARWPR